MKKRAADIIIEILKENQVDICFSVVGGGAMHLNNAFVKAQNDIHTIYNHHEQACSMAAEGYARLTGRMAAVCVTSGPGGTNAINGVQGAWVDSLPMVIISGHPRLDTTVAATGLHIRTRGVQENDIITQVRSITKYAVQIKDPMQIRFELEKAIYIAMEGRRGPVWIDIPLDIQGTLVEETNLARFQRPVSQDELTKEEVDYFYEMLEGSKRPCILSGSGIRTSDAIENYRMFCNLVQIPIVGGSLQADIDYNEESLYYGMSGTMGPRCGNFILQNADLILVLGNSLSTKQTGFNQEAFAPNAKIVMVDIQEDEGRKPGLHIDLMLHSDLNAFFKKVIARSKIVKAPKRWIGYCDMVYKKLPKYEMIERNLPFSKEDRVPALLFWKEFLNQIEENAIIALGNSSCIHGALQYGVNKKEQRVLVNYNCGSMGDDLPEAIGAVVGSGHAVYCVTGDGSIMMNLQELQTIVYNQFPVKVIVFNNEGYGAIRTTCANFFEGVNAGCDEESGISFPSFEKIAKAFGMNYFRMDCVEKLQEGIDWINQQDTYCMLEVYQRVNEIKGPKVASKMDENGVFYTPGLEVMEPSIDEQLYDMLMKVE